MVFLAVLVQNPDVCQFCFIGVRPSRDVRFRSPKPSKLLTAHDNLLAALPVYGRITVAPAQRLVGHVILYPFHSAHLENVCTKFRVFAHRWMNARVHETIMSMNIHNLMDHHHEHQLCAYTRAMRHSFFTDLSIDLSSPD